MKVETLTKYTHYLNSFFFYQFSYREELHNLETNDFKMSDNLEKNISRLMSQA